MRHVVDRWWTFCAVLLACAVAVPAAQAQYFAFGKNKVQYDAHDWHYVQSAHFDVYYYTGERGDQGGREQGGGKALADFTARTAEAAYADIAEVLGHDLKSRVPLIVYQGHSDFAVTNAVDLPVYAEGIGGATELFKNRIVVPFTGDYGDFRRVVRHELVHAALNDLFYGGSLQSMLRMGVRTPLPLWLNEGLAEYVAGDWDAEADMFVREAVLRGELPAIDRLGGYAAYWGGRSVWDYVAVQYGTPTIGEILSRLRETRSVEESFEEATGVSLKALSTRWQQALREVHYPEVTAREDLDETALPLATRADGRFHSSPALAPQGDRVAYVTAKGALFDVYVRPIGGGPPRKLIDGQASTTFEGLRLQTPSLAWSPDGRRLAVAVKSGASDALAVVDVASREAQRYRVPGLDQISAVDWHPAGDRLAFAASAGAQSDIYVLDLRTHQTTNYTRDVFSDHEPVWTPGGGALVFHSDRGDRTAVRRHTAADLNTAARVPQGMELYRLPLAADRAERLTRSGGWDSRSPRFGAEADRLLFISNRNGIPNLYEKNLRTGAERPLTDVTYGITQLALSADGTQAAVVSLDAGAPSIYRIEQPFARRVPAGRLAPTVWAQRRQPTLAPDAPALRLASAAARARNPLLRAAQQTEAGQLATVPSLRADRAAFDPGGLVPVSVRPGPPLPAGPTPADTLTPPAGADSAASDSAAYGGVRIDFGSSDAGDVAASPSGNAAAFEDGAQEAEALAPKRYKLHFSPDLIYGTTGYDALYGVQGVVQMQFSDLLGGHQIRFTTNLLVDLRNADYALSYSYLPRRIDWTFSAYHTARLLPDYERSTYYRYRRYGASVRASLPLNKFHRLDVDAGVVGVNQADIANPEMPATARVLLNPAVTFTRDVTTPGRLAPRGGHRLAASLSAGTRPISFATLLADGRAYASFAGGRYALALRASGGASFGARPQLFYAAGVQNWLNRRFDAASGFPVDDPADFAFATPVLPLRGHALNAQSGARFALVNAEVRFPVDAGLLPVPVLPLRTLHGTAFADVGGLWGGASGDRLTVFRETESGARVFDDVLVGAGVGLRTLALGYPVRLDVAWPFDGQRFGREQVYLSVGFDF